MQTSYRFRTRNGVTLARNTCLPALTRFTRFLSHQLRHASNVGYGLKGPTTRYKHYWAAPWKGTGSAVVEHTAQRWKRGFHSSIAGVTASSKAVATQEAQDFWRRVLEGVDRPVARAMMANLDLRNCMGIPGSSTRGRKGKAPLLPFYESIKHEHPTKVVLVRVGEFYEAMGTDAVILVQWAGLNPMGSTHMPPRAGCPHMNIRRTLQSLVEEANLSVAVCEEAPEVKVYGSRTKGKQRFLAGVVTPAQPHYLYGLLDANQDPHLGMAPPILGIAASAGGYQVMEVQPEVRLCTVTEGLTEDAVSARLFQGGLAPPLYIHSTTQGGIQGRLREGSPETEWEQRVTQLFHSQSGTWKRYSAPDAVQGLLQQVKRDLSIDPATEFTRISTRSGDRPKPLYHSTASQLGLHKTRGIPNLLDFVLPRTAPQACRSWVRRLLLLPPSPAVGAAIWNAVSFLSETKALLPHWVIMEAGSVALKLRSEQATCCFFCDLSGLLAAVVKACAEPGFQECMGSLLESAQAEMGYPVSVGGLEQACRSAAVSTLFYKVTKFADYSGVFCVSGAIGRNARAEIDVLVDTSTAQGQPLDKGAASSVNGGMTEMEGGMEALGPFFRANEGFRGQIRAEVLSAALSQVEAAGARVEAELACILGLCDAHITNGPPSAATRAVAVYDCINNGVWVKLQGRNGRKVPIEKTSQKLGLAHPHDRHGAPLKDRASSAELDAALEAYRQACARACEDVRDRLRSLARSLMSMLPQLVCACTVSIIGAALDAHVRSAKDRGWGHPLRVPKGRSDDEIRPPLQIEGMWPYWLDGAGLSTVRNNLSLDSMVLLTGPNMAGKSTIMRSTIAVTLLGSCGLLGPARAAQVPYIDAFMLRTFSADAPIEGRSSFAVEMVEMRYVMDDAREDALVLLDELGKGTEVAAGTALAAAFLERLASARCRGIFATHLHALLDTPLKAPGLRRMKMETCTVEDPKGQKRLEPTWRLAPGECRDSLALEVAANCRLPKDILQRASEHYQAIHSPMQVPWNAPTQASQPCQCLDRHSLEFVVGMPDAHSVALPGTCHDAADTEAPEAAARAAPSIELAADILRTAAVATLAKLQATSRAREEADLGKSKAPSEDRKLGTLPPNIDVQVVLAGTKPPPSVASRSCVYVVKRSDGMFYCGQSDNLANRLRSHETCAPVKGGKWMQSAYLLLPSGFQGKSIARAVESRVIQALRDKGFSLISDHDACTHRSPHVA